ncbi:MAG: response regulator transcription factor [Tannerellaceae bacterium]|nr:response regulator transcription factor [Tannerellaceae bacterium]
MSTPLKIVIADPSPIIRAGLDVVLKKIPGFRISLTEVSAFDALQETLKIQRPDILLINPLWVHPSSFTQLKEDSGCNEMKCFALVYTAIDPAFLRFFDDQITLFEHPDEIRRKLERLVSAEIPEETDSEDSQSLSVREKEIVVCVVKGMTNREIADTLYLSTHTVITHRRNIARKLQIHSASGLTVYAIVNKLIALEDIQTKG